MVAYPPSLTARFNDDHTFGVWQHAEGSLPLNAQSVLYSVINLHGRLPTSSFTRPGIDRWASGPPPLTPGEHTSSLTLRLRTFRFPFGCGDQLLNLANEQDSLGHFSKRTTGRCSYHRFHAQSACTQLVSRSFHIPSRILFSFHSRYL